MAPAIPGRLQQEAMQDAGGGGGKPYFFRIPAHMTGYGFDQVPGNIGDSEAHALAPLDSKRFLAPDVVATDTNRPPPAFLTPGASRGR